jgi:hypothetical protein
MMKGQGPLKDHRERQGGSQDLSTAFSERTVNFYHGTKIMLHLFNLIEREYSVNIDEMSHQSSIDFSGIHVNLHPSFSGEFQDGRTDPFGFRHRRSLLKKGISGSRSCNRGLSNID